MSTIRALREVDPSGVLLEAVSDPIREYLRCRKVAPPSPALCAPACPKHISVSLLGSDNVAACVEIRLRMITLCE